MNLSLRKEKCHDLSVACAQQNEGCPEKTECRKWFKKTKLYMPVPVRATPSTSEGSKMFAKMVFSSA